MPSFRSRFVQGLAQLPLPETGVIETVAVDINWADAGATIAVNDVVQLVDIPPNVEVLDWKFITEDIDSNGTPTVAFSLGVLNAGRTAIGGGANDTWATGITAGQTGGAALPNPASAQAINPLLGGRTTTRAIGLVATAATATAQLAGRRATLILFIRA